MKKSFLFLLMITSAILVFGQSSLYDAAPKKKMNSLANAKAQWTLQFQYNLNRSATAGVETDGSAFYVTVWNNNKFYKYSTTGTLLDSFAISGTPSLPSGQGIRDLAYDGTYFYGGTGANIIYKMNFTTKQIVGTITLPTTVQVRHISYDPTADGGLGGFWVGNWTSGAKNIYLYSRTATLLNTIPDANVSAYSVYGSALDTSTTSGGPYLWLYSQTTNGNDLVQIKISTKQPTGIVYDITQDVTVPSGSIAGGCFLAYNLVSGTATLGGVVQGQKVWGYDLASTVQYNYDLTMKSLDIQSLVLVNSTKQIKGTIKNSGSQAITSFTLKWQVNSGTVNSMSVTGVNIASNTDYNFTHSTTWTPTVTGTDTLKVWTENPNGNADQNPVDDKITKKILIVNTVVQRRVMVEEFTNASCAPCAAANPAFNTLLQANPTKVTALKYQTNWPGADPMNAQNPTEVATRVSYYGVSGVPNAEMDGNVLNAHPTSFNQTVIDDQYNVPAMFALNLTHSLTAAGDSIIVKCVYQSPYAQTFTGPLKLHVAITEEEIVYCSAPGTNGEKEFYNVMRKMLPNASGTTLPLTWTANQKDSVIFKVKLPAYIYDKGKIGVVAFVQDDSDKNVKQSAFSAPQPMLNDAGVTCSSMSLPAISCNTTHNINFEFKNYGTANLTSVKVYYQIDNQTPVLNSWTGNLTTGNTATINLTNITFTAGSHVLKVFTADPNGVQDKNQMNDTAKANIVIFGNTGAALPLTQGFVGTAFPPANWSIDDVDNDGIGWSRVTTAGGFGSSTNSARKNFYNSTAGKIDRLNMEPVNLSGVTQANLIFNVAYAQYSNENDLLEIHASTDCGQTWPVTLYTKSGINLKTANATTSSFVPTATQWRHEIVNLSNLLGQTRVFLRFHALSDYGNNLYIDDIQIANDAGIQNTDNMANLQVFPNPVKDFANITFSLKQSQQVEFILTNIMGQTVKTLQPETYQMGENIVKLDVNGLSSGVYMLKVIANGTSTSVKITVL